jgi:hypothetical protein
VALGHPAAVPPGGDQARAERPRTGPDGEDDPELRRRRDGEQVQGQLPRRAPEDDALELLPEGGPAVLVGTVRQYAGGEAEEELAWSD